MVFLPPDEILVETLRIFFLPVFAQAASACSASNCWFSPDVGFNEAVSQMTLVLYLNETLEAFYPSPADTHLLDAFQWPLRPVDCWCIGSTHIRVEIYISLPL